MELNRIKIWLLIVASIVLVFVPPISLAFDEPFYITLIGRIMIFAIAALSLELILGFGGMISFGHAAYLGLGAYAVGILSFHGINNGWLQLIVAISGSAIIAMIMSRVRRDGVATDPGEADVWANGDQFEGIDRQQWDQQHRHALGCLSIH